MSNTDENKLNLSSTDYSKIVNDGLWNNNPALAVAALREALDCNDDDIQVAEQDTGFDWITV